MVLTSVEFVGMSNNTPSLLFRSAIFPFIKQSGQKLLIITRKETKLTTPRLRKTLIVHIEFMPQPTHPKFGTIGKGRILYSKPPSRLWQTSIIYCLFGF